MSALIGATTASMLSASTLSAQTFPPIPIVSGAINLNLDSLSTILNLESSTVLTPIGAVRIDANGFNGTLTNRSLPPDWIVPPINTFTKSKPDNIITPKSYVDWFTTVTQGSNQFLFVGTTNGISPIGTFTNAPTTINFSAAITNLTAVAGIFPAPVSGGSIELPGLVNDSTLASSNISKPEFQQEYRNDFNSSSFVGGRVLGLEDK